jgi:hypothetical protein
MEAVTSSTTMNRFRHSIALNNQAVLLLHSPCNYQAAMSQLKEAISTLKRTIQMQLPLTEPSNIIQASNAICSKITINDCMYKSMACFNRHEHEDQDHFLYQDAIFIPNELGNSLGRRERSMVSCMIIFNLALVHHLSAMWAIDSDPSSNLRRALKLYELAFNLQREELVEINVLFVLAVTNNVGMTHRQLGDEEPAKTCFQSVLSTLMYLADRHQAYCFPLDGFFINTRSLISKGSVAPAA